MAKGVCSAYIVGGGGGGDNAAEKSVDRQQLPEHVPLFTQSHYAGQIYYILHNIVSLSMRFCLAMRFLLVQHRRKEGLGKKSEIDM